MKHHRIIAAICVIALLLTQYSFLVSAKDKKTIINLEEDIKDVLIITKQYDKELISEISFPDYSLKGIKSNDEVVLAADVEYEQVGVGEDYPVKLRNFHLFGKDSDKYELILPEENFSFESKGSITPRPLHILPEDNTVHYTVEEYPMSVSFSIDSNDIVEGDSVNVTDETKLYIERNGDEFYYALSAVSATDDSNYSLVLSEDAKPQVQVPEAPELEENYLYSDSGAIIEWNKYGIVANGNVHLEVKATEKQNLPISFALYRNGEKVASPQTVTEDGSFTDDNGEIRYRYIADFVLDIAENQTKMLDEMYCDIDNGVLKIEKINYRMSGNQTSYTLILDTEKPAFDITPTVSYDNRKKEIIVNGSVTDIGSGISKIEYKWDEGKEYTEIPFDKDDDIINNNASFSFKTEYGDNMLPKTDGNHSAKYKLYLRVTDCAGNIFEPDGATYSEDSDDGIDSLPPEVTKIVLAPKDEQLKISDVLRPYSFGNYTNKPLLLTLTVIDRAEDENSPHVVDSVNLIDNTDSKLTAIKPVKEEGSEYQFLLDTSIVEEIKELSVKMTDENGTSSTISIKDLLIELGDKTVFDWAKNIKSDRWIFDYNSPDIGFTYDGQYDVSGKYYFGNEGGTITTLIKDKDFADKDLHKVTISRSFKGFEDAEFSKPTTMVEETYTENSTNEYSYVINTSDNEYQTGDYIFSFVAEDYAGNTIKKEIVFYVDHSEPNGEIIVNSPNIQQIKYDGGLIENWVIEDTDSNTVTFHIYPSTTGSPVKTIIVYVNNKKFPFDCAHNPEYIELNVKKDEVAYVNDCYNVRAEIITCANNKKAVEYLLHIDAQNPVIERVEAKKKNNALENLINFLSFGTFFNDSIILSVTANDGDYGAGLDHVEFFYENATENLKSDIIYFDNIKADKDKDNIHKSESWNMEMLFDEEVVYANVKIKVVDNLGKETIIDPKIKDGDSQKTSGDNYIMLEKVRPLTSVALPACEGTPRNDNQIWYRTDKNISLSFSDNESGIREVFFSVNGKELRTDKTGATLATQETTSKAKITSLSYVFSSEQIAKEVDMGKDGRYHIECYCIDNAGNQSYVVQKDYYRDVTIPEIKQFTFNPYTVDGTENTSDFVTTLRYRYYFNSAASVIVTVDDTSNGTIPSSGNNKMYFKLVSYENGEEKGTTTLSADISDNRAECVLPENFKGQVYAKADDQVGNISNEVTTYAMILDTEAPKITIEPLPNNAAGKDSEGNALYTETVSFKVTVEDYQSGLREIIHSKKSELDSYDSVITSIGDDGSGSVGNGWEIVARDENLITAVTQVFTFSTDDNDISLTFNATDRARNKSDNASNTPFTIDTIAPQVTITTNPLDLKNSRYYQGSTSFTITVTERNFDSSLMISSIQNSYSQVQPSVTFSSTEGSNVHTAVVNFPEGDYDFSFTGQDLGGHTTQIFVDGSTTSVSSFHMDFNVDNTPPSISTNFQDFETNNSDGNYFKESKTAEITVVEHNFLETDMSLRVETKSAGSGHSNDGWYEIGTAQTWTNSGDTHSISIPCKDDAIYRVSINPQDRAENRGNSATSPIFEIDMTVPKLSSRNDVVSTEKGFVETPYSEVYDEKKKDNPAPKVEFEDNNFNSIEVTSVVYCPAYKNGMEFDAIEPDKELNKILSGTVQSKEYSVSSFDKDGVYTFTYVATDKAGNKSEPINDTYFRLVNTDILAYISKSNMAEKTGYYSLMDSNGKAISKKASDFDDLEISIISLDQDTKSGDIVLRNEDQKYSTDTHTKETVEAISKTAHITRKTLPESYFSDTFKDDSLDTRLYLSVSIDDNSYLDLASIHIDNEPPTATLPDDFVSWHNYAFTDSTTITLTNISETLNEESTKVYECSGDDERTPINYSYDKTKKELSFELAKGLHNIDVVLVDEAGNEWNVDRVRYLRVGNFRIYLGVGGVLLAGGIVTAIILIRKKKKQRK